MSGNLHAYRDDPVSFARDVLDLEPHPKQAEVMRALVKNPRVEAPSGYACGSTTIAAVAVLWWLSTRRPALAVTVSPTHRQCEGLLWREIRKLHCRSGILQGKPLRTDWSPEKTRLALGVTNIDDAPTNLFRGPNVLLVEDGTWGTSAEVGTPLLGAGGLQLKVGVPRSAWFTVPVPAQEVASCGIPGLVAQEWIDRIRREYGEDSTLYRSRVLGLSSGGC